MWFSCACWFTSWLVLKINEIIFIVRRKKQRRKQERLRCPQHVQTALFLDPPLHQWLRVRSLLSFSWLMIKTHIKTRSLYPFKFPMMFHSIWSRIIEYMFYSTYTWYLIHKCNFNVWSGIIFKLHCTFLFFDKEFGHFSMRFSNSFYAFLINFRIIFNCKL